MITYGYIGANYQSAIVWYLSSEILYHCIVISNSTDVVFGAGYAYSSGAPGIIPGFLWSLCCPVFCFLYVMLFRFFSVMGFVSLILTYEFEYIVGPSNFLPACYKLKRIRNPKNIFIKKCRWNVFLNCIPLKMNLLLQWNHVTSLRTEKSDQLILIKAEWFDQGLKSYKNNT